jgi:hypothetical protein
MAARESGRRFFDCVGLRGEDANFAQNDREPPYIDAYRYIRFCEA